jgi:hypothetical protein
MDPYMADATYCIYNFGQPCLTLLASYMKATYDNYNTNGTNETFISKLICNYFTAIILDFCATTQLLATVIIGIGIDIYIYYCCYYTLISRF